MHGRMKWRVGVVAAAALVESASAGTLYTTYVESIGDGNTLLAQVDPSTGGVSEVGSTGIEYVAGLTWDATTESLYAIENDFQVSGFAVLHSVDPLTGSSARLGTTTIPLPTAIIHHPGLGGFIVANAIWPVGSDFYFVDYDGTSTLLGHAARHVLGLTYDPVGDRVLYSTQEEDWGEFDPTTGDTHPYGMTGVHLQGIVLDPDSETLFGLAGRTGAPGGSGDTLFTVDLETGAATPIATLREEFYASLAVIPIPTPGAGLIFALPMLAATRRPRTRRP